MSSTIRALPSGPLAILFLKRVAITFCECFIGVLGLFLTVLVTVELCNYFPCQSNGWLPWVFLGLGLAFTLAWALSVRRVTRNFKIEYDAVRFLAARRAAILHPRRSNLFRTVGRALLWLPSAAALFPLLFFPQASHLVHAGSERRLHHQIHIPWNWAILRSFELTESSYYVTAVCSSDSPWPFGHKHPGDPTARLSACTLGTITARALEERRREQAQWRTTDLSDSLREVRLPGLTLTCRQHSVGIECETTSPLRPHNLEAGFFGSPEDIPAFYKAVQAARPYH